MVAQAHSNSESAGRASAWHGVRSSFFRVVGACAVTQAARPRRWSGRSLTCSLRLRQARPKLPCAFRAALGAAHCARRGARPRRSRRCCCPAGRRSLAAAPRQARCGRPCRAPQRSAQRRRPGPPRTGGGGGAPSVVFRARRHLEHQFLGVVAEGELHPLGGHRGDLHAVDRSPWRTVCALPPPTSLRKAMFCFPLTAVPTSRNWPALEHARAALAGESRRRAARRVEQGAVHRLAVRRESALDRGIRAAAQASPAWARAAPAPAAAGRAVGPSRSPSR